jgi:hypothetical protein
LVSSSSLPSASWMLDSRESYRNQVGNDRL